MTGGYTNGYNIYRKARFAPIGITPGEDKATRQKRIADQLEDEWKLESRENKADLSRQAKNINARLKADKKSALRDRQVAPPALQAITDSQVAFCSGVMSLSKQQDTLTSPDLVSATLNPIAAAQYAIAIHDLDSDSPSINVPDHGDAQAPSQTAMVSTDSNHCPDITRIPDELLKVGQSFVQTKPKSNGHGLWNLGDATSPMSTAIVDKADSFPAFTKCGHRQLVIAHGHPCPEVPLDGEIDPADEEYSYCELYGSFCKLDIRNHQRYDTFHEFQKNIVRTLRSTRLEAGTKGVQGLYRHLNPDVQYPLVLMKSAAQTKVLLMYCVSFKPLECDWIECEYVLPNSCGNPPRTVVGDFQAVKPMFHHVDGALRPKTFAFKDLALWFANRQDTWYAKSVKYEPSEEPPVILFIPASESELAWRGLSMFVSSSENPLPPDSDDELDDILKAAAGVVTQLLDKPQQAKAAPKPKAAPSTTYSKPSKRKADSAATAIDDAPTSKVADRTIPGARC